MKGNYNLKVISKTNNKILDNFGIKGEINMKIFPDLTVVAHDGYKSFVYSSDDETIKELMNIGGIILEEKDYTSDDFAYILGDELEDRNMHGMTNIGDMFVEACKKANIEEKLIVEAIKEFIQKMLANY